MTLVWYRPPNPGGQTLAEMLDRLRPLGVRWQHNYSGMPVTYRFIDGELMAEVGALTVHPSSGVIAVWPATGIGLAEQRVLCGSALRAFERPPRNRDGWTYFRRGGKGRWRGYILIAVQDEGLGRLVANHHASMHFDRGEMIDRSLLTVADQ